MVVLRVRTSKVKKILCFVSGLTRHSVKAVPGLWQYGENVFEDISVDLKQVYE